MAKMASNYKKHFIPLESNPEVFNELIRLLDVSDDYAFVDVFSLEPDILPRPALAVILIFPTTNRYEDRKAIIEAARPAYSGRGPNEPVVWFKQTINNACGLYAILHALSNSEARNHTDRGSLFSRLLQDCIPQPPRERAEVLELSDELEHVYVAVASKGDTTAPADPEDDVDFHYICFAKSEKDAHLYELDGDSKGPTDTGIILSPEQDIFSQESLSLINQYIEQEQDNVNFNLMALVRRPI